MNIYPLDASLTHGAREYSCVPVDGYPFSHILIVWQGQSDQRKPPTEDVYGLEEATEGWQTVYRDANGVVRDGAFFPPSCVAPRSFLVVKCGADKEGLYLIVLGARPSCDCYGFRRWGGCKHVSSIVDAVKRGLV